MLPSEDELLVDGGYESSDLAMDVATILSQLSAFEQQVGRMLTEGHTVASITRELKVGRQCVEDAVAVIRSRLVVEGFGGEVQEDHPTSACSESSYKRRRHHWILVAG